MRAMGSTQGDKTAAGPGGNAWPPTRQQQHTEATSRNGQSSHDLPPQPGAPPAVAPTPGRAAPLAPRISQLTPVATGPTAGYRKDGDAGAGGSTALANRDAAAKSIEDACRCLHRTEALRTQIKLVGIKGPDVGQPLDEAKHAYEQALASFGKKSFLMANEFANASNDLSRAVSMVLCRALRARVTDPVFVPPKGIHRPTAEGRPPTQDDFSYVGSRLSRILWLFENGTLPSEVIEQARKIASWSEDLYREAQQSFRDGAWDDALELMQAAEAAAHSAEHVCKMCYLKDG